MIESEDFRNSYHCLETCSFGDYNYIFARKINPKYDEPEFVFVKTQTNTWASNEYEIINPSEPIPNVIIAEIFSRIMIYIHMIDKDNF